MHTEALTGKENKAIKLSKKSPSMDLFLTPEYYFYYILCSILLADRDPKNLDSVFK